jgi:hypothetical protein
LGNNDNIAGGEEEGKPDGGSYDIPFRLERRRVIRIQLYDEIFNQPVKSDESIGLKQDN